MKLTDGRLTEKQLNTIHGYIAQKASLARTYKRYFLGENPPIMDAPAKKDPDNRVPVPIARKLVDTMAGYGFKPGKLRYTTEGDYITQLKEVFDANDEELLTYELGIDAMTTGWAYEIVRMDEELNIKQYRIDAGSGYMVYDDTLDKNPIAFVHMVKTDDNKEYATIYYTDIFIEYERTKNEWLILEEKEHPFGMIPAIDYQADMDRVPLFYSVIALMEQLDKVMSRNYADDLERFANAYLLMLKRISTVVGSDGKSDADKIAELRMFDALGEDGTVSDASNAVTFLTKPSRGTDVAESADRYERMIYDMASILNPQEFSSGTSLSGIAYRLKTLFMELRMANIEAYFSKGLQRRIQIIENAQGVSEPVTIQWQRNLPVDLEYFARALGGFKGIISDESILELLPADIVPDIKKELQRISGQITLGDE